MEIKKEGLERAYQAIYSLNPLNGTVDISNLKGIELVSFEWIEGLYQTIKPLLERRRAMGLIECEDMARELKEK